MIVTQDTVLDKLRIHCANVETRCKIIVKRELNKLFPILQKDIDTDVRSRSILLMRSNIVTYSIVFKCILCIVYMYHLICQITPAKHNTIQSSESTM